MKTKKISFANLQGKLSRTEMTKIMAGSGDCQENSEVCTTSGKLNCCSGMRCTNYRCGYPTR